MIRYALKQYQCINNIELSITTSTISVSKGLWLSLGMTGQTPSMLLTSQILPQANTRSFDTLCYCWYFCVNFFLLPNCFKGKICGAIYFTYIRTWNVFEVHLITGLPSFCFDCIIFWNGQKTLSEIYRAFSEVLFVLTVPENLSWYWKW